MGFWKTTAVLIPVIAVGLYFVRQYTRGGVCYSDVELIGKVAIITGSNTGIGKMNTLDHVKRELEGKL